MADTELLQRSAVIYHQSPHLKLLSSFQFLSIVFLQI
jgi:hypothetical protein